MTSKLVIFFVLISFGCSAQSSESLIEADSLAQLLEEDEQIVVLDTRSPEEYASGHLENARFVNYATFQLSDIQDLSKDTPIVVYCMVGGRSGRVAQQLKEAGYENVKNLKGGIQSWEAAGNKVERE